MNQPAAARPDSSPVQPNPGQGVCIVNWERDPDTFDLRRIDDTAVELLGYPTERWFEKQFWESRFHPEDLGVLEYSCRETLAGRTHDSVYRLVRADGVSVWVHSAVTVEMRDGKILQLHGVVVDISRRIEAQSRLAAREALLDAIARAVPSGLCLVDGATGGIAYANDQFFEIWRAGRWRKAFAAGTLRGEQLSAHCASLVQDASCFLEGCGSFQGAGSGGATACDIPLQDGRMLHCYTVAIADAPHSTRRLYVVDDVTENRRVQAELREWKARYDVACEQSGHIVFEWMPGVETVRFGGSVEESLGVTREELERDPTIWPQLVHPDDRERFLATLATVRQGAPSFQVEYRLRHRDGTYRWMEGRGRSAFGGEGKVRSIVGFVVDITERRRAENERRQTEHERHQAQRMESLGILAGGIAHDFNNILTAIVGNTDLVAEHLPAGSELRRHLERVLQSAGRARDLVGQILTYSRQTRAERRVIDPAPVVREAIELVEQSTPAGVEVHTSIASERLLIEADESQIHSLVVNLLRNAWQAVEAKGGRVDLSLSRVSLEARGNGPTEFARLVVRDDGEGMTAEVRDRVFEPFFTTKPAGEGAGLGMAVSHGIIVEHKGFVEVDSEPTQGTEFRVFLPLAKAASEPDRAVDAAIGPPANTLRILVVDDEESVLEVIGGMLGRLGHEVVLSSAPAQALEIFRGTPSFFDLVLTDLSMPSSDGVQLAAEIHQISPGTPVVLITGFDANLAPEVQRDAGINYVLRKPFVTADLKRVIAQEWVSPRA